MRLYLSSQHMGRSFFRLGELLGDNKNVAVIANAIDDKSSAFREERVKREIAMLGRVGLQAEDLDLREFFGAPNDLDEYLDDKSMVWVRGGNTFLLRRAMIASGFDEIAIPRIIDNKLVYGGYSAALIAASCDLVGVELVDDPTVLPPDYPDMDCPTHGLGLIDFHLIPHEGSTQDWAKNVERHASYLRDQQRDVRTLKDGQVYIIDKGRSEVVD